MFGSGTCQTSGTMGDFIECLLSQPHLTLEVLFTLLKHRLVEFDITAFWTDLSLHRPCQTTKVTNALIRLRKHGYVGPILTTNFDSLVPDAMSAYYLKLDRDFRFLTELNLESELKNEPSEKRAPRPDDVFAIHGTVFTSPNHLFAPPLSATACGLARPLLANHEPVPQDLLSPTIAQCRPVLVLGYAGNDHFDLNPLLRELGKHGLNGETLVAFEKWTWVVYEGNKDDRERVEEEKKHVKELVPGCNVIPGDPGETLSMICDCLGLPDNSDLDQPRDGQKSLPACSECRQEASQDFNSEETGNAVVGW